MNLNVGDILKSISFKLAVIFSMIMIIVPLIFLLVVGFDKIPLLWEHDYLLKSLRQTVFVCVVTVFITHLIGVLLAIYIAGSKNKFHRIPIVGNILKSISFKLAVIFSMIMIIVPLIFLLVVGIDKIPLLWEHGYLLKSLKQTLFVCVVTVFITHLIGVPLAIYIAGSKNKFHRILIYAMLISTLVSGIVKTVSWISLLSDDGFINSMLMHTGVVDQPLDLLYNNLSIIIGFVYVMLPLVTINVYTAVCNIDSDLIKAAKSLGAKSSSVVNRIILPQVKYEILTSVTIIFITTLTLFSIPKVLGGSDKMLAVLLESSVSSVNYADAIVVSLVMIVISSILILIVSTIQRQSRWM